MTRGDKIQVITAALKHLGIGFAVSSKGEHDEIFIRAGEGRLAFAPDGQMRNARLDKEACSDDAS